MLCNFIVLSCFTGGTTNSDSDDLFVTSSPSRSVMQESSSAFTCYARVKVSTSCNSIVLLQTILLRPLDSTIRYLIDPKGEAEKSYVCATVPCDASGHLTVGAILLAESKRDKSVTVEPQNLDRNSKNLYQNMDLCIAGKSGNTATATCKETTSDSVTMVLKGLDIQNLHVIHFHRWLRSVYLLQKNLTLCFLRISKLKLLSNNRII